MKKNPSIQDLPGPSEHAASYRYIWGFKVAARGKAYALITPALLPKGKPAAPRPSYLFLKSCRPHGLPNLSHQ